MSRITLAVDGSEHSMVAATVAGSISKALGAPVHVLNVVTDVPTVAAGAMHEYTTIENVVIGQRELLKAAGNAIVAKAAMVVREAGGYVESTEVAIGAPAREIAGFADNTGSDWIVMGRRGLGEVKGLVLGSVVSKVGHLTDKSLVTTEDVAPSWEHIILAVDGSEHSQRAATVAGRLSKAFGSQVDIVNVVSDGDLYRPGLHAYVEDYALLQDLYETRRAQLKDLGSGQVSAAARMVEAEGGQVRYEEVVIGDPATEIETMVRTYKADVIVVGRRGLGALKGLLFGSVSQRVAHSTDKTTITVE